MKITELTYTVTKSGGLRIPADIIKEMGINPGENVRVAYLSHDGDKNEFREFLLSSDGITGEMSEEQKIAIPTHLLEEANIPLSADIEIACGNGFIVVYQDNALSLDELSSVISSLEIAGELVSELPTDESSAEILRTALEKYEEEA